MALPELTLPDGTPAFCADEHEFELMPMYADVPMQTGHDRRRRAYTVVPRSINVKLDLTEAQAQAFFDWYEGPLEAGVQWFSARLANQGPGLKWWKARFVEAYQADADESGRSTWVKAKLLLVGESSDTGPYVAAMSSGVLISLFGEAELTIPVSLGSAVLVELLPSLNLGSSVIIALLTDQNGATPSSLEFERRWIWQRLNYAAGRSSDVTDTSEFVQRSWMGF